MITIRLWHYKLLPFLPNKMLVSEWRECIAIKRQWEKGTLKHRLVSYVMYNDADLFKEYITMICREMNKRNIKYQMRYYDEVWEFCINNESGDIKKFLYPEHNERYLKQCLYNLQEKADRGIVTKEEWQKMEDKFGGVM